MTDNVIIIGGGIVGMSIACHLARAGVKTLLFDRADRGQATDAGAGILTAEPNGHAPDFWLGFAATAVCSPRRCARRTGSWAKGQNRRHIPFALAGLGRGEGLGRSEGNAVPVGNWPPARLFCV